MSDTDFPEWVLRLELAQSLYPEAFPKGEVSFPQILHDDWCALLERKGACDCEADVIITFRGRKVRVLPDGELEPV